jgi:DNA repair protein RecO (recombination protein O)
MPLVITPAIVLSALRYSESSKIVRLATRDHGVQSAIAKGALRPRSRFGGALQLLSEGQAQYFAKEHRELHLLTAFDLGHLPVGLTADLARYATAAALAEVMLRFAPPDPHPESYDLFLHSLRTLESADPAELDALGFRVLWHLVSVLGFAPSLDACVRDGTLLPANGTLPFSTREGGALCPACAAQQGATELPAEARADLAALLDPDAALPALDERHGAAHRRLLARYVRYHLAEGAELPALDFWLRRPWVAA